MSKEATAVVVGLVCLVLFAGALMVVPLRTEGVMGGQFGIRMILEDTSYVELKGNGEWHRPGRESEFAVEVGNRRTAQGDPVLDNWAEAYCLVLVDRDGGTTRLADQAFEAVPGETVNFTHRVTMPEGLPDGPYGISVVLPSVGHTTTTIWFGRQGDGPQGPWDGTTGTCD